MEGQAQTVFENKPFVCDTSEIRDTSGCLRGSRPLRGETQKKDTTYGLSPIGTQCEPMGLNAVYGERALQNKFLQCPFL